MSAEGGVESSSGGGCPERAIGYSCDLTSNVVERDWASGEQTGRRMGGANRSLALSLKSTHFDFILWLSRFSFRSPIEVETSQRGLGYLWMGITYVFNKQVRCKFSSHCSMQTEHVAQHLFIQHSTTAKHMWGNIKRETSHTHTTVHPHTLVLPRSGTHAHIKTQKAASERMSIFNPVVFSLSRSEHQG